MGQPVIDDSTYLDMQMILEGYRRWLLENDPQEAAHFNDGNSYLPSGTTIPTEPYTSQKMFSLQEQIWDENPELDMARADPEAVERIRINLQSIGMEKILDDGKVSHEEFLVGCAEFGKARLEKDPERFKPDQEALDAASKVLATNGIEDPDGSMARGLAAQMEAMTSQVNEGLGLSSPDSGPAQQINPAPLVQAQSYYTPR